MQTLIVDTLRLWREAERILNNVPPMNPNHEVIRGWVVELRSMYARVSESADLSADAIAGLRAQLEAATNALTGLRGEGA